MRSATVSVGLQRTLLKRPRWALPDAGWCSSVSDGRRSSSAAWTRMPRSRSIERGVAGLILAAMFAGFSYSAVATVRLSRQLFRKPAAIGPDATIDNLVSVANFASGKALRDAVNGAGWPA